MVSNLSKPKQLEISLIDPPTAALWPPNAELVEDLKKSMSESGQYAPVFVRQGADGRYSLTDGRHRFQAAKDSGWKEIWVRVLDGDGPEAELIGLSSNLKRHRLSEPEFAAALQRYEALHAELNAEGGGAAPRLTSTKLAQQTGVSSTAAKRALRNKKLSPKAKAAFDAGHISADVATELTKLTHPEQDTLLPEALKVKRKELKRNAIRAMVKKMRSSGHGSPEEGAAIQIDGSQPARATSAPEFTPAPTARIPGSQESCDTRWRRLIDGASTATEAELRDLSNEELRSLYSAAVEIRGKATLMESRLRAMGVIEESPEIAGVRS